MWQFFLLILLYFESAFCNGESCEDGIVVFSRFPGQTINETKPNGVLLQEAGSAITLDCIKLCKESSECSSLALDYSKSSCNSFSNPELTPLQSSPGSSHFQKGCYNNISKESMQVRCSDRSWTFDVVMDAFLNGFSNKELPDVSSRFDCEQSCLKEEEFECKSANYNSASKECTLSRETRRTQPQVFWTGSGKLVIYLENQCVPSRPSPCRYHKTPDVKTLTTDSLIYAKDENDCEKKCDSVTEFVCRSYSFLETKCHLSSDDASTLAPSELPSSPKSVHGDVVCPADDCSRGVWTYEMSPGHTLAGSDQKPFDGENGAADLPDNSNDCRLACDRKGFFCPSFIINHAQHGNCYNLDRNSQGRSIQLVPTRDVAYFEKVCLNFSSSSSPIGNNASCKSKLWTFTRIPGHQLDMDKYNVTLSIVTSRENCEQKCLDRNCSSALYDESSVTCKLSNETRFTSSLLKIYNPRVSYLENNCLTHVAVNQSCEWKSTQNAIPRIKDLVIGNVTDKETCRQSCLQSNKLHCSSFSFNHEDGRCVISSESRKTMTANLLATNPGNVTFYESSCEGDNSSSVTQEPIEEPSNTVTETNFPPSSTIRLPLNYSFCRSDQEMAFERIPGFEPFGNYYFVRLCYGSSDRPGIVKTCKNMCLNQYNCRGFIVDYGRRHCVGVISATAIQRHELRVADDKDFFRLDCLPKLLNCPNKLWSFERVIDQTVTESVYPRFILRFISRAACQCLCLQERQFTCRSIVHEGKGNICKMFDRNRASGALISDSSSSTTFSLMFSQGSEYLENNCADTSHQLCRYSIHRDDVTITSLIHSLQVMSMSECRRACDLESSFQCRSFSFVERVLYSLNSKNLCLLSSDNESTSREGSLRFSPRSFYYERDCRS